MTALKNKSFSFAMKCLKIFKHLHDAKKELTLSRQLLRLSSSISANIHEAQNIENKNEFMYRIQVAQRECTESIYCLERLHQSHYLNGEEFHSYNNIAREIFELIKNSVLFEI